MSTTVSLVGAGPGDPELLTLRALDRLRRADLILYDALLSATLLELAPRARRLYVGKRAGRHSMAQRTIARLMIRAARRGERVVRLKGGDPFVLGRGGEEMEALWAAGVPCEVVPGVTSAIAAPASVGIPLTHRDMASGFVVVSGHSVETARHVLDGIAPHSVTVVVLMGLARRAELVRVLRRSGWAASTPAAIVLGATTSAETSWIGSLADLPKADLAQLAPGAPGTLVIGEVVKLARRVQPARADNADLTRYTASMAVNDVGHALALRVDDRDPKQGGIR